MHHIMNDDNCLFDVIDINKSIQGLQEHASYKKRQTLSQCLTSRWDWTSPHSMAHEVLPKGRCEPVFLDMWTFAGNKNFKWSMKQHHGQVYRWQYHPWLLNQNSCWLGSHSWVSSRNQWWKGAISYCPFQEKYQLLPCWTLSIIWVNYHATATVISIQVNSNFKPHEDCVLDKAKQWAVSKKALAWLKILW